MNSEKPGPDEDTLSPAGSQSADSLAALQRQVDYLTDLLTRISRKAVIADLTATVIHEINNPVFGILNFLELSKEDLDPDHPVQDYLQEALDQTERISWLVNELLSVSRVDNGRKEPFDPAYAVHSAIALYKKRFMKSQIEVELHNGDHTPKVFGVRGQLTAALIHILDNARQSMEQKDKGLVRIETGTTDAGWFQVTVEDFGIGMPNRPLEELLRPLVSFWEPPGAGMGLHHAKNIVESMDGNIALETAAPLSGTAVTIVLPPYVENSSQ
jgi:signal transduction histidine kinase